LEKVLRICLMPAAKPKRGAEQRIEMLREHLLERPR
jgi:hypothetical protein